MPSSSIYAANIINQQINDYLLSMFPIRWCSNDKSWSNGSKASWRRYFSINVLCKTGIAFILSLVALYLVLFHYSSLVEFQYVFSLVTFLPMIGGSFCGDLVCYIFGTDMVLCCNWCYYMEDKVCSALFKTQNSNMWCAAFKQNVQTQKSVKGTYYLYFNFNPK